MSSKGKVQLKDGSTFEVECNSTEELASLLTHYNNKSVNPTVPQKVTPQASTDIVHSEKTLNPSYSTRVQVDSWNEYDVLMLTKKLVETGAAHGTIKDAVNYVAKHGSVKRQQSTVYKMARTIKMFVFDGKTRGTGITRHIANILKTNGFAPGSQKQVTAGPKKVDGRKARYHPLRWSIADIALMARTIHENVDHGEIMNIVYLTLKQHGETKNRRKGSLYTIVSDIRNYFKTGDGSRIADKMIRVMRSEGLSPFTYEERGTPVAITRHHEPEQA